MAAIDTKEYNDILQKYVGGQAWLGDVSVEIEGGENNIDPMTLIRAYEEKPSADVNMSLAIQFIRNKHVKFLRNGEELLAFTYIAGEDLSSKFATAPYLLDVLLKLSYGLMLKKLTPPSVGSETEERLSASASAEN